MFPANNSQNSTMERKANQTLKMNKGHRQTFIQRRHTISQQDNEKMAIIIINNHESSGDYKLKSQ